MIPGKNYKFLALLPLAAALVFGSCASKPPAPEPEPVVTPAPEPAPKPEPAPEKPAVSQAELDELLAKAKVLKKKSFDLKLFEVLPDEYKAAEGSYATAFASHAAATKDPKVGPAAKADLEASIAAYQGLIDRGVVDLAESKRENADAMKAISLKVGADAKAAERFQAADEAYAQAAALMAEGKHEEAIGAFEKARLYYELAYKRSVAGDLRDRIEWQDYAKWDSGNFQLADNKFAAEEGLWASGTGDRALGIDMLDESILRYNLVVEKGRQSVAVDTKVRTDDSKERAEEIKAQVAVKDDFAAALKIYEEGEAKLAEGDYEEATAAYEQADAAFEAAYESAADKRAKALAAMEAAAAATEDSARKAEEAEAIVEQGSAQ